MYANARNAIVGILLLVAGIGGCWRFDPAMLEGRWAVQEFLPDDSSTIKALMLAIGTALVQGTTIEFRTGQALVPLAARDTLRFDYRVQRDTLEFRAGAVTIARFQLRHLDHHELRLRYRHTMIVLYRQ